MNFMITMISYTLYNSLKPLLFLREASKLVNLHALRVVLTDEALDRIGGINYP